jgi:hypothetical protein
MFPRAKLTAALVVSAVACASTPPETSQPAVATVAPAPEAGAREAAPELPSSPTSPPTDAGASDGCADESETVPVVIATQHARGRGGFVAKMQAPPLNVNEMLIDTRALKGGYTCCVMTEVEAVRFECELADGTSTLGRVYRETDTLVIDPGEGHEAKRLPISCGAWLRFRGPVKDCESSPP